MSVLEYQHTLVEENVNRFQVLQLIFLKNNSCSPFHVLLVLLDFSVMCICVCFPFYTIIDMALWHLY